jgi:hypothetical protein
VVLNIEAKLIKIGSGVYEAILKFWHLRRSEDICDFFRNIYAFENLSITGLKYLANIAHFRKYATNEVILSNIDESGISFYKFIIL